MKIHAWNLKSKEPKPTKREPRKPNFEKKQKKSAKELQKKKQRVSRSSQRKSAKKGLIDSNYKISNQSQIRLKNRKVAPLLKWPPNLREKATRVDEKLSQEREKWNLEMKASKGDSIGKRIGTDPEKSKSVFEGKTVENSGTKIQENGFWRESGRV